jgi:hypothetical protein
MKIRMGYGIVLCCLTAIVALAQNAGLEGTWVTDGVPAVEAAIKAKKSVSGLAEGTRIKFKVDTKKNKVSGSIFQLNTDKEFDIVDGVLTDKTFTFKSVEVVGFANNSGGGRGGGFGNNSNNAPLTIAWKGELTDANTVNLKRLSATGEPTADPPVVYHRGK